MIASLAGRAGGRRIRRKTHHADVCRLTDSKLPKKATEAQTAVVFARFGPRVCELSALALSP